MNTWSPLWNGIVESSLWDESDVVVKVFLTMLAVKDADHIVRKSAYQIGRLSRKTEVEVLESLKVLASPDSKRLEKQQFDGRRIKLVEEGWLILNGEKYRDAVRLEMRRARNRKAQAAYRERKQKIVVGQQYKADESAYVKAEGNGDTKEADRIAARASDRLGLNQ